MNGWQQLWELVKCAAAITGTFWCVMLYSTMMPLPEDTLANFNRVTALFLVAVVGGGIPYGTLSSLEWVIQGFRPKKSSCK
ncbi:hypothetical protein PS914_00770 [Pseudomonas fluorescens]|nr:hypothetical protein PS914_00770 [Pseudomonas fluorescens]